MGMDPDPDTLTRNPSKKGGIMSIFSSKPSGTVERNKSTVRENTVPRVEKRRPLKTVALTPPDYKVQPDLLIDSYLEKEIKYLGIISNVPFALDPTKRTELLRYIDQGKRQHQLPWNSTRKDHDAILTLSARQVKLLKRDGEELLQRLEIHNIAAVSYVRDDDQHILAFKTAIEGHSDNCNLVICECQNKEKADEICSLIQQTFVLVYTELTMKFFDQEINAGRPPSSRRDPSVIERPSPPSDGSESEHGGAASSIGKSSHSAALVLQKYIEDLRKQLNSEELQQFAAIPREYRQSGSIKEFCTRLQQLYGPNRTNLFPGMRPYIPEKDIDHFETFLERHGLQDHGNSIYGYPGGRRSRRTPSEASTSSTMGPDMGPYSHSIPSEMDELDRALLDVCHEVEHLETTIDS
ncbi:cerebral cavernous malformations 2 protein-like isoform X2 [Amphiura filiformis]|uniref:cerebral cavernous malformations 2 protein-like isoform X2 n=1 Tax=Amphiura filiformis TaxID=82378 RepID=UPI003B216450